MKLLVNMVVLFILFSSCPCPVCVCVCYYGFYLQHLFDIWRQQRAVALSVIVSVDSGVYGYKHAICRIRVICSPYNFHRAFPLFCWQVKHWLATLSDCLRFSVWAVLAVLAVCMCVDLSVCLRLSRFAQIAAFRPFLQQGKPPFNSINGTTFPISIHAYCQWEILNQCPLPHVCSTVNIINKWYADDAMKR